MNKEYSDPLLVCTFIVAVLIVIMGIFAPKDCRGDIIEAYIEGKLKIEMPKND